MNNQAITFSDLSMFIGMIAAVLGLWWRMETRVSSAAREALIKAQDVDRALHDYKLEVAENYAKNGFIRDVESRIGERFDKIVDELHGMRTDFQKAMVDLASKSTTRRRS